jgi:tetratricopeptide (TPR) repeat protein
MPARRSPSSMSADARRCSFSNQRMGHGVTGTPGAGQDDEGAVSEPGVPTSAARGRLVGAALVAVTAVGIAGWRIASTRVPPAVDSTPRTPVQLILALERTAAADPSPRGAAEALGAACLRLGHFLSARVAFRRAAALGSDSAWLHQQMAWCALRLDYRAEALDEYRHLLRREPHLPDGYLRLAAAALRMGEPTTARAALRAMPPTARQSLLTPASPAQGLQLGRYLSLLDQAGPPEACLRIALRAVKRQPSDPTGFFVASRACLKLGRPQEALRWLEEAVQLAPARADLHALRGDICLALAEPPQRREAHAAYARAVALDPTLGPAQYRLGQLALATRSWEEAGRAFEAARALGTEPIASLRGVARAAEGAHQPLAAAARWAEYREQLGDTVAARRLYRRLLDDPRTAAAATLRLADLDARDNRLRQAIQRLETAVHQSPRPAEFYRALARLYRRGGHNADALAAWHRAAALDRAAVPEADQEMAAIAESLVDFDAAERHYEASLRRRPDDAACRLRYGSLLLRRRSEGDRLPRAISELEQAVALAPDDPAAVLALGQAYEAAHRDAESLITLRHAIDLAPGAGPPYLALGRLARRLGRREEGREMLAMYRLYRRAEQQLESLKVAVSAHPEDPADRLHLADYYFIARDFSRAAADYERALAANPSTLSPQERRDARRHLALAYERLARREDAAAQLALADNGRP